MRQRWSGCRGHSLTGQPQRDRRFSRRDIRCGVCADGCRSRGVRGGSSPGAPSRASSPRDSRTHAPRTAVWDPSRAVRSPPSLPFARPSSSSYPIARKPRPRASSAHHGRRASAPTMTASRPPPHRAARPPALPHPRSRVAASAAADAAPAKVALPFRVGHGFDLHRLELLSEMPDLKLILGGVEIEHDRGCVAHSDGDVLLHCVVDAITGALGLRTSVSCSPTTIPSGRGARPTSSSPKRAV